MRLRRFLYSALLFGTLFLTSSEIKVKSVERMSLIKAGKLNALDFQHIKGISYWYSDTTSYNIINRLMENHEILDMFKNFKSDKQDILINNVKYSSYIKSPTDEHYRKVVYPEFIRLNKELQQDKSRLGEYELVRSNQSNYFLRNNYAYGLEDNEVRVLKRYRTYLDHLESLIRNNPESDYDNIVAITFLNLTGYLPLIKTLNQGINLDEKVILSLIASESIGYNYIAGISGDVGIAQLSPDTIRRLYLRLKQSKLEEDFLYREILKVNTINLEDFERLISESPADNITLGMYLLKELNKVARNEAQLILLYKMGNDNFSLIRWTLQGRILNGDFNSSQDILSLPEKDQKRRYMRGLYHYFKKKERFSNIEALYDNLINN